MTGPSHNDNPIGNWQTYGTHPIPSEAELLPCPFCGEDKERQTMMTVETIEAAYHEWSKTIKVIDSPTRKDAFGQGYVAGRSAMEAERDELKKQLGKARSLIQFIEDEATRYAEMYQPNSDGRNTFIIFRDMVANKAKEIGDV